MYNRYIYPVDKKNNSFDGAGMTKNKTPRNISYHAGSRFNIHHGIRSLNGATVLSDGINFTIKSIHAKTCTLHLYHYGCNIPFASIQFPEECHHGDTFSMIVENLDYHSIEYTYSMDGLHDEKSGYLFDNSKELLDPYAKAVAGQKEWGKKRNCDMPLLYRARPVKSSFNWDGTDIIDIPAEDMVIYELHVRGFTKDEHSGVHAKGTFKGIEEKIPYLKQLGINTVELMPVFEFDEMESDRFMDGNRLYNFWGYNTVSFFAPNTAYTYQQERHHEGDELKHMIRELKRNKIAVILDVVFNHTAEGNEKGPVFGFKGIDNTVYYMLPENDKSRYYNFSGCGNTLNCNHPFVIQFIINCLRYWVTEYKVDGFRFDLASVLTRDGNGMPLDNPPVIHAISTDPVLSNVKFIAEAWDAGGLYQIGSFPSYGRWAEWNGRYRDDIRKFLKGDYMTAAAMARLSGSGDIYAKEKRSIMPSVNFIICHDGFTLYDLYAYNTKHNEKNGWNNTDGDNNGNSWNCGIEGKTDNKEVENLRRRMVKNAFTVLMMSRGAAMFYAGDEFCNSQDGNNNAYCQDNKISWVNWDRMDEYSEITAFVSRLIKIRKEHAIIRKDTRPASCGFPTVSFHNGKPWDNNPGSRIAGIMYAGVKDKKDDIVLCIMNMHWEDTWMELPELPGNMRWEKEEDTYFCKENNTEMFGVYTHKNIFIHARSCIILLGRYISS